jgi:capsular polysaccharide biosynthesis protein
MSRVYRRLRQRGYAYADRTRFDTSDGAQTVQVAPATTVPRNAVAWDVDPESDDAAGEDHRRDATVPLESPALLCSRIPGGAVATRAGIALTDDGRWLRESVGAGVGEVAHVGRFGRIRLDEPQRHLDEDVAVVYSLLSDKKIGNYYHWVVEGLARAAMLEPAGVPSSTRVLVPEPVLPMHLDHLELIGIDRERVLPWSGVPTRFRTVYLATGPQRDSGEPAPAALDLLRARAAGFRDGPPRGRLWVSRRLARRRRRQIANESDLFAVAQEHGFEEVVAELLTIREQVELFAQAEAIAGLHGAGLANAVFMAQATTVVEVASDCLKPRQKPIFWNLAAAGGQRYARSVGHAQHVDPARFARVLDEALA